MCKFLVAEKRGTVNFNYNLLRNGVLSTLLCTATRPAAFYVPNLLMTVLTAQHNHDVLIMRAPTLKERSVGIGSERKKASSAGFLSGLA